MVKTLKLLAMKFNVKEYRKEYYKKNKDKIKEKVKKWVDANSEYDKQRRKEYRNNPIRKLKMKKYLEEYNQKPEIKEKRRLRSIKEYKTEERKKYLMSYVKDHKRDIRENALKYSKSNKGLIKIKAYRNNPEVKVKMNEFKRKWMKDKIKNDLDFAIKHRLRRRLNHAKKIYIKEKRYLESDQFNLDYEKIINHLKPFPKEITKYHIDHIKPLCSFDFTDLKQIQKAFAPENHQWLTIQENLSKGGKIK